MDKQENRHPLEEVTTLLGGDVMEGPLTLSDKVNRQLWKNSPLAGSELDRNPDALFNAKPPNLAVCHEKPWHRAVVYMRAQGATLQEIADRFGKTVPWISQLCRQPWFQERLIQELKASGRDALQHTLEVEALPSIQTLIELRDNAESEPVRLKAAQDLVDRFCGKAVQRTESKQQGDYRLVVEDKSKVEKEIAQLEEQLGRRNVALGA